MINYDFRGRLQYIPGGALNVQMSAWPAAGANWWEPSTGSYTVVAAYQAKGAASLAASYVNLANPGTYDAAPGTAPAFDTSTGWTFNGTTNNRYLTTGIIPNSSYTVLIRFSNVTTAGALIGTSSGEFGEAPLYVLRQETANRNWYNNGDYYQSSTWSSGVMCAAGKTAYKDGTSQGTISGGSNTYSYQFTIGARNMINLGRDQYFGGDIQAVAIYSTTLDATQVAEITTNMAAL